MSATLEGRLEGHKLMTSNRMILAAGYAMSLVHPGYVFKAGSKCEEKVFSEIGRASCRERVFLSV